MTPCTYCGDEATQRDHLIPASSFARRAFDTPMNLVPACGCCNSTLGAFQKPDLATRALFIRTELTRRHRKLLKAPEWTAEELADLGPELRQSVAATQQSRCRLQTRLEALRRVQFRGQV